ncbi:hypothetical protein SYNPS1DRAFT_27579 [Syncephalis pseudoplumigaleata]|uniref:Autophagy-related protein 14 n=1 Tax=Syncephalis pseudoplumigaleata TaxID=1712513 RepID=A0A4P9Z3X6_9FUNG|nr:hypothetical protein SYNPS1DRAFT_27579 [Syncephalis pseudoplumigaleata]|eukprot:RKP26742.1 hypothetical protein SYNPS1DRAFT_27579 [Syncephalis pseudoplumigaleata]
MAMQSSHTYNFLQAIKLVEMHRKVVELYKGTQHLAQQINEHIQHNERELLYSMNEQVDQVQQERIHDLADLYPIAHATTMDNAYTIRDLHLPNTDYRGFHSEDVATALGYTCHLVEMISFYLRVPLIYPMIAMASRAYIINPLAPDVDQAIYPLYGKGQDAARLMTSQHLNAKRPRDTLLNLLTLLWKTSGHY